MKKLSLIGMLAVFIVCCFAVNALTDFYVISTGGGSGCDMALVAKTGQTTSYWGWDDGHHQKGVAWPSPRFTDNSDGTVTDNLTGLVWLKHANCAGDLDFEAAATYCHNLQSGSCGLSDGSTTDDWRLPNANELRSLIDYSNYNPALPTGHPFTNVQTSYYWTSTSFAANTDLAWQMRVYYGDFTYAAKSSDNYVWPVRDGN